MVPVVVLATVGTLAAIKAGKVVAQKGAMKFERTRRFAEKTRAQGFLRHLEESAKRQETSAWELFDSFDQETLAPTLEMVYGTSYSQVCEVVADLRDAHYRKEAEKEGYVDVDKKRKNSWFRTTKQKRGDDIRPDDVDMGGVDQRRAANE